MTKEEIKQKYKEVGDLIIERTKGLLKYNDENPRKSLEIVHLIEADIKYFLDRTKKEIYQDLEKTLSNYSNSHIK
jgi:hypothetical protein